jgi:hypothetical protein
MSISTAAKAHMAQSPGRYSKYYAIWLYLPAIVFGLGKSSRRSKRATFPGVAALFLMLILLVSCGGVSTGGGGTGIQPENPMTYHVIITGTSAGTPADAGQSTVVALVVN